MQYEFFSCMAFSRSGLFFLQRAYTYDIVNISFFRGSFCRKSHLFRCINELCEFYVYLTVCNFCALKKAWKLHIIKGEQLKKEQTKNQQEKNQKKSQKLQWHPAFCSALRLELLEDAENLEFTDEFQLTEKPLQIDCTVVKVKRDCKIKNEIGKIFRKHNIF